MPIPAPLTDQHKLSVPAFDGAVEQLVTGVFTKARQLGVRVRKFSITHPLTILNDGQGNAYVDLSEKASNQGQYVGEWAMDPAEPVQWPDLSALSGR